MVEATKAAKATGADLHALIRHGFGTGDRLYGVVDASRDKELAYAAPRRYGQTIHWLFEEGSGAHMLDVAPYMVPIAYHPKYPYEGSGHLDLWARKLGTSAGILLICPASAYVLLTHLYELFRVTDETDHRYYFRYYDPRVLRAFMPTCSGAQAQEFFGPVRQFLVESERSGSMLAYRAGRRGVEVTEMPLGSSAESGPIERSRR